MVKYLRDWNISTKKKNITDYSIQCNSLRRIYVISPGIDTPQGEPRPTAATYGLIMEYHSGISVFLPSKWSPAHHWSPSNLSCWWMLQAAEGSPKTGCQWQICQPLPGCQPSCSVPGCERWWGTGLHSWGLRPSSRCLLEVIVGALAVLFPFGSSS